MPDRFTKLPDCLKIEIYEYDLTYRMIFRRVLLQLKRVWFRRPDNRISSFMIL